MPTKTILVCGRCGYRASHNIKCPSCKISLGPECPGCLNPEDNCVCVYCEYKIIAHPKKASKKHQKKIAKKIIKIHKRKSK